MIQTYEVRFALESGHTLNVLVASPSRREALEDAMRILKGVNVRARHDYDPDETEVRAVIITEDANAIA